MIIKQATKADIAELLNLQKLAFASVASALNWPECPNLHETYDDVAQDFDNWIVLKAVDANNRILGSIRGQQWLDGTLYLLRLMVHPDYRKQGIASHLLDAITEAIPHNRVQLETLAQVPETMAMYLRRGFRIFKYESIDNRLGWAYMELL